MRVIDIGEVEGERCLTAHNCGRSKSFFMILNHCFNFLNELDHHQSNEELLTVLIKDEEYVLGDNGVWN